MRRLRKDRTPPGGFRARVLAPLSSVPASLRPSTPARPGRHPPGCRRLLVPAGITVFQSVGAADAAPAVPALPWTVQSRIADMAFLGDTLYCAVNGSGVVAVDQRRPGHCRSATTTTRSSLLTAPSPR